MATPRRRRKKTKPVQETIPQVEASGDPAEPTADASGDRPGAAAKEPTPPPDPGTDKYPRPGVAWGNVVTDTLNVKDPAKVANRLRSELELGLDRTNYGMVLEALDRSDRNLEDAGRLYRSAKAEEARFDLACLERLETLRSAAIVELQEEYTDKKRRSPVNKDIEDRLMNNWPDEYRAIKTRQAELHQAVRALETLVAAWASRAPSLRIMAEKARPVR